MTVTVEWAQEQPHFEMSDTAHIMGNRFSCSKCKVIHTVEMKAEIRSTLRVSNNVCELLCPTYGCDGVIATWMMDCTKECCV